MPERPVSASPHTFQSRECMMARKIRRVVSESSTIKIRKSAVPMVTLWIYLLFLPLGNTQFSLVPFSCANRGPYLSQTPINRCWLRGCATALNLDFRDGTPPANERVASQTQVIEVAADESPEARAHPGLLCRRYKTIGRAGKQIRFCNSDRSAFRLQEKIQVEARFERGRETPARSSPGRFRCAGICGCILGTSASISA